jgi:hypothetical protein
MVPFVIQPGLSGQHGFWEGHLIARAAGPSRREHSALESLRERYCVGLLGA